MRQFPVREYNESVATQNKYGDWVPAIPEPYPHMFRLECGCGRKFWTRERFKDHYGRVHILGL